MTTMDYWTPPAGLDVDPPEPVWGVDPEDALQILAPGMSDVDRGVWLGTRRTGIGASDVSGMLGLNRWKSRFEVYADKRGEIPWEEPDNEAAEMGVLLEPVMREWYSRTKLPQGQSVATHVGTVRSVRWPWLVCNPDGIIINRHAEPGMSFSRPTREGYEGKTCSLWLAHEWDGESLPDHAEVQCQVVMAVCGFVGMHVTCCIGGQRRVTRYVARDDELIRDIVDITQEFWEEHILAGVPPDPDASVACAEFLTKRYPYAQLPLAPVVASAEDVARIRAMREQERAASSYVKACDEGKNLARQLLGDAEDLVDANGRTIATWRQTGKFDVAEFRADHPELYAKYVRSVDVFDAKSFADAHPALYRTYRGRVLLVK